MSFRQMNCVLVIGDYNSRPSAKIQSISKIAASFLVWSEKCQINKVNCGSHLHCYFSWQILLLGARRGYYHHSVNKEFEANGVFGWLAGRHVRSNIHLITPIINLAKVSMGLTLNSLKDDFNLAETSSLCL